MKQLETKGGSDRRQEERRLEKVTRDKKKTEAEMREEERTGDTRKREKAREKK